MAGLMLADKTAAMDDKAKAAEAKLAEVQAELDALKAAPAPEPEKVEVPVIPDVVTDTLAELAARAEAVAASVEEKVAG
jgi:cell division protein ZapA